MIKTKQTFKVQRGKIGVVLNFIVFLILLMIPFVLFSLQLVLAGTIVIISFYLLNLLALIRAWEFDRSDTRIKVNWTIALLTPSGWYFYLRAGLVLPWVWKHIDESFLLEKGLKEQSPTATKIDAYPIIVHHFEKIIEDLKTAEKFIHIQYFIINNGIIWKQIKPILIQKKQEGVDIKILLDYVGNVQTLDSAYQELIDIDIPVVQFNKVRFWKSTGRSGYRSHNKFLIIDNKIGWFGGTNIGDDYASMYPKYGYWCDLHVRAEGELVYEFNSQFITQWFLATKEIIPQQPKISVDSYVDVEFKSDGPQWKERVFLNELIKEINSAEKSIKIATPYYILPKELDLAMHKAVRRGVKIEVVTTGKPDKLSAYFLSKPFVERSTTWGVNVYRTNNYFFHSKFTVIDSKKVITGTSNLDYRAIYHHFESNITIKNELIAQDFEKIFSNYLETSWKTKRSLADWSILDKIFEKFAFLIGTMF